MPRARRNPPLVLIMNGRRVGRLSLAVSGAIRFTYARDWLDWQHAIPVSLSLPLAEKTYSGAPVASCFDNLLPDSPAARERLAAEFDTGGTDAYHLLRVIGGDCVGALQFFEESEVPDPGALPDGEILSDADIGAMLTGLPGTPLGLRRDDDFRIALPGLSDKTALLKKDGEWIKPAAGTPTTHILKTAFRELPGGIAFDDSVENEFFCTRFFAAAGAHTARSEICSFDGVRALVVERFDRKWTRDGRLIRLPQEDVCQALGLPREKKFERDGGPGLTHVLELLGASDRPAEDRRAFLRAQILFWLLGATNGHGKNFSLSLLPGGRFRLTPLYDVVSMQPALHAGQLSRDDMRLAMSIGHDHETRIHQIAGPQFIESAKAAGVDVLMVEELLAQITERVPSALETTMQDLPEGFPRKLAETIAM